MQQTRNCKGVLRKSFAHVCLVAAFSLCGVAGVTGGESGRMVNAGPDNIAINGYDTVAYFTEGRPLKGKPDYTVSWQGVEWQFANPEHRRLFAADPEHYAPQFGGFCSMALTKGAVSVVDPEAWTIVDGRLYLNFNKAVRDKFRQNPSENLEKANAAWAKRQQNQP